MALRYASTIMPPVQTHLALLILLLTLPLSGCAEAQSDPPRAAAIPEGHETFTYTARFTFEVPAGWETARDVGPMRAIALSPLEGTTDTFRENVNVVLASVPDGMALDTYAQQDLRQTRQMLPSMEVLEVGAGSIGELPAHRRVYEHDYNGRRLRAVQYMVLHEERAYILTGTALASTFDEYEEIFEQVIRSFVPD